MKKISLFSPIASNLVNINKKCSTQSLLRLREDLFLLYFSQVDGSSFYILILLYLNTSINALNLYLYALPYKDCMWCFDLNLIFWTRVSERATMIHENPRHPLHTKFWLTFNKEVYLQYAKRVKSNQHLMSFICASWVFKLF